MSRAVLALTAFVVMLSSFGCATPTSVLVELRDHEGRPIADRAISVRHGPLLDAVRAPLRDSRWSGKTNADGLAIATFRSPIAADWWDFEVRGAGERDVTWIATFSEVARDMPLREPLTLEVTEYVVMTDFGMRGRIPKTDTAPTVLITSITSLSQTKAADR